MICVAAGTNQCAAIDIILDDVDDCVAPMRTDLSAAGGSL
jgi:hypothetical protein